jgi:hypothetical protein
LNITFNGLNINDNINYTVEEINHEETAKADINLQKIARTNESVILRKGFGTRTIKATIIVQDSTLALLDARLDDLKETIEVSGRNFDIEYASGTRRFVCTGFIEGIERKPRWAVVKARFECYKAFGEATASTTELFAGKTTTPYTDDIEIEGNAPAQPDITITINSITPGAGDKFMKLLNIENGDYVKLVVDDFQADDVIVISTGQATVTRNGIVEQYLGIMPEWLPGDNDWEYSDDFTARNIDISFSYKKRYL